MLIEEENDVEDSENTYMDVEEEEEKTAKAEDKNYSVDRDATTLKEKYICDLCNAEFTKLASVKKHITMKHTVRRVEPRKRKKEDVEKIETVEDVNAKKTRATKELIEIEGVGFLTKDQIDERMAAMATAVSNSEIEEEEIETEESLSDKTLEALIDYEDSENTEIEKKPDDDELLEVKHGLIAAINKVKLLEENLKESEAYTNTLQTELENKDEIIRNYLGKMNELEEERLNLLDKAQKASVCAIKYQSEAEKLKKEKPSDDVKKRNTDLFEALRVETKKSHNLEDKIKRFTLRLNKLEETENKLKQAQGEIGELVASKANVEAQLVRTTELSQNYKEAFEKNQTGGEGKRGFGPSEYRRESRNNDCREFANNGYCRRMECHFQHPENPESMMTEDCQWWLRGNCRHFPNCLRGKHDQAKYNSDRSSRPQQQPNPSQPNQPQKQQSMQYQQNLQQMNQNINQNQQLSLQKPSHQMQQQQPVMTMINPLSFFGQSPVDREAPTGKQNTTSQLTGNVSNSTTAEGREKARSVSATTMAGQGPAFFQQAGLGSQQSQQSHQSWNQPQNMMQTNQMMMNPMMQAMNQQAQMLSLQNPQQPMMMMFPQSCWPQFQGSDKTA